MRYLDFNTAELLKEATGEVSPCPLISHPNSDPHCDLRGGGRGPAAENVVEPSHCACLQPALLFSSAVPQPGVVYEFEVQIPNEPHLPQDGQRTVSSHNQDEDSFTTGSKYTQRGVLEVRSPRAVAR